MLKLVFSVVMALISDRSKSLTKENEFLLCLVKFKDMAYHLKVLVKKFSHHIGHTMNVTEFFGLLVRA